jgi:hypothetical protein
LKRYQQQQTEKYKMIDPRIPELQAEIASMAARLEESRVVERQREISAAIRKQRPDTPDALQRLAVSELAATDGDAASLVEGYFEREDIKPLIAPSLPAPARTAARHSVSEPEQRTKPSLAEMLNDIASGNAGLKL